jgi:hypothetical protein
MPSSRVVNGALRRALVDARLRDVDIADRLGVDPKTVQRWLAGRLPQPGHRRDLARLVDRHEYDLWPELTGTVAPIAPEIKATYPHRGSVPRRVWTDLFGSARSEIDVLVYSGLFLAEDVDLLRLIRHRADAGITVRIALGDPDSAPVDQRGAEEGIGCAMAAKIRNTLVLLRPLVGTPNLDLRLHATVLYSSLYRADDEMLVNHHVYGLGAASAPVLHLRGTGDLAAAYRDAFERVWAGARSLNAEPLAGAR